MDKTGMITLGEPEVTDVVALEAATVSSGEVLALAAGLEQRSQHPLARAILRYAGEKNIQPVTVTDFQSLTGAGVSAQTDGRAVYAGSPALFQQLQLPLDRIKATIDQLQAEGKTVVLVGDATGAYGLLAIRDNIRPKAVQAIQALHAAGIEKVIMLTGDNQRTAHAIARELGIDEVHADLKPEDKAVKVRELAGRFGHVAMVGDGVNDAPALAEASVGVAMGAAGTDVALETADVALMADDLEKLAYAVRLAKRNQRVVSQNLALSAVVITVLVVAAVSGVFTLSIAVLGHELSEFIVIGSGLRMLRD